MHRLSLIYIGQMLICYDYMIYYLLIRDVLQDGLLSNLRVKTIYAIVTETKKPIH